MLRNFRSATGHQRFSKRKSARKHEQKDSFYAYIEKS